MQSIRDSFEFDYFGSDLVYGRGCIERLEELLSDRGLDTALVVCGTNVGANEDVTTPLRRALGDRLAAIFDETTPAKSAETVYDGIDLMGEVDPDVLIGVGGGSSLDIARQMSVFAADGRSLSEFRAAARDGRLEPPSPGERTTPVVVIPTTLAGADISNSGSIELLSSEESPTGRTIRTGGLITPVAMFYDPSLFETTPTSALAGSAINGFDKSLETIYARNGTPITDATAVHSLRLFRDAIPHLPDGDPDAVERAVIAIVLAQFDRRVSIVHAFGHGVSRHYPVHQGIIHAVVVPHVLRYLLENVDAHRELLAVGLGIDAASLSNAGLTDAIVDAVIEIRDSLDLPTRLRDVDPIEKADIPAIAEFILEDDMMRQVPEGLDPTVAEIETVLRDAW